ncbi:AraC family transcriptional regulator [Alpinimonas psychrophila]|uniref:AraC-like DNA-binding protein n=1 Tax=Alpinimonas psychrophila TaxID=748908 RepID=A0A7W3JV08_9MICO|nr:AraC family transcriptional regulator [Alpinimonas psychrophila]MBA8829642.1 AraC-like DNA-binding protein [Alpinimonas psychrophila]
MTQREIDVPLHSRLLIKSDFVDDIRDGVNNLTEDEHILTPGLDGRLQGTVAGLKIGDVSMVFVSYGSDVTVVSPPNRRRILVALPLGPMGVECGNNEWVAEGPFALHGTQTTKMAPHGGLGCLIAAVDVGVLESLLASTFGRSLANPMLLSMAEPLKMAAPELMTSIWSSVIGQVDASPAGQPDAMLEQGLSGILMSSILTGLSPYISDVLEPKTKFLGPRYVAAAKVYLEEHFAEDISIEAVASAVGISARQLTAAFQEHIGKSPVQLLREIRLEKVRGRIEASHLPGITTVSSIAMASGFSHLGRFSAHYAEKYQEQPSETLKRVRLRRET